LGVARRKSLSKNVVRDGARTTGFTETLNLVDESLLKSKHSPGSARIQSGLHAMFEKARLEGFEAGKESGFELGSAEGRMQGKEEFERAHCEALDQFRMALEDFVSRAETAINDWYVKTEDTLTTLAIEIARRAMCQELEASRDSVLEIARNALAVVRHGTDVRVRVNPMDAAALNARKEQILTHVSGIRNLEVVADLNVPSGCEIETDGGVVDARIESYLARLAKEAA
jgi:flagellar biosynthesis/type III secretory pathway protein FliH